MSKAMIQLTTLMWPSSKRKRQIQAVKDVTIHINEGDIYGIVGYSEPGNRPDSGDQSLQVPVPEPSLWMGMWFTKIAT